MPTNLVDLSQNSLIKMKQASRVVDAREHSAEGTLQGLLKISHYRYRVEIEAIADNGGSRSLSAAERPAVALATARWVSSYNMCNDLSRTGCIRLI